MEHDEQRPWVAHYAPGVPADIAPVDGSLVELLAESAERFGDRVALDFFGATVTYRELLAEVDRAAGALAALGVGPGDRVALVLPNCAQHVVAFYAVLRLRAVVVEHNPLYTADELRSQLADHGATVALVWDKTVPQVRQVAAQTGVRTIVAVDMTRDLPWRQRLMLRLPVARARTTRAAMTAPAPDVPRWHDLVAGARPVDASTPTPEPDDVAALQYTGGTTGTPKGAVLTHRNLRANAAQGRAWVPGLRDGEETVYAVLPLFHVYGLTLCLTFAMSIGATLVLLPRFDVDLVLAAMRRRPATFLPAVPPIYSRLAAAATERGADLTSIRVGISGAMPLRPEIVEEWEAVTGGLLVEGYGMTETSPVAVGNPVHPSRRPGAIGLPFPGTELRIVDPEDPTRDRPPGEAGEILLRGPQVFSGYWNLPDETARVLLPDGWLRTGDIAVMDADGFVTLVDRIKELIITGGFNVYPSEVEAAVRELDAVDDVAVVGMPAAEGEEVVAAVVLADGHRLDEPSMRAALRERLTAYKVPRRIVALDELPRSMVGKVLRREVVAQLAATRAPAG